MKVPVTGKIRRLAATAALVLASVLGGVAAAGPAHAAASCTVRFRPNLWTVDAQDRPNYVPNADGGWDWTGEPTAGLGFQGTFTVTNTGDAINPWRATYRTPPGTRLVGAGIYNAKLAARFNLPTFTHWSVKAVEWNGNLPTNGHVDFGFQGVVPDPTYTGTDLVTRFTLAGTACTPVT